PRYGHVAFFDQSVRTSMTGPRMLVFGGLTTGGALADSEVYVLSLSGTPTWSKLTLRSRSAIPSPRQGPAGIADALRLRKDPDPTVRYERRVVVYGGRDASGTVINSDKVWYLWMADSAGAPNPEWKSFVPQPDPALTRRPTPRANFSGILG